MRQHRREFYAADDKRGSKRQTTSRAACVMPLLRWVIEGYTGRQRALAVDATTLGTASVCWRCAWSCAAVRFRCSGRSCPPRSATPGDRSGRGCRGRALRRFPRTGPWSCWPAGACMRAGSLHRLLTWAGIRRGASIAAGPSARTVSTPFGRGATSSPSPVPPGVGRGPPVPPHGAGSAARCVPAGRRATQTPG